MTLFSFLIFLIFLLIAYIWMGGRATGSNTSKPRRLDLEWKAHTPPGYSFHVGHTWAHREDAQQVRVGVDDFAANLIGAIDHIEVIGTNRWVRQGQRIMTVQADAIKVDLLSPIEGVIAAVNEQALKKPSLATSFPFGEGWVALVKAPEFWRQQKNLIRGELAELWMHNCELRVRELLTQPDCAAEGGERGQQGLLARVSPEFRQKLVKEFFRT